jgi:hypothetical protein
MRDRSSQKSSPQTETGLLLNLTTATIFFYVQGADKGRNFYTPSLLYVLYLCVSEESL